MAFFDVIKTLTINKDHRVDAYNQLRPAKVHKTLCMAPSTNMVFATDGTVRVCCHNAENIIGQYPQQSIEEIWESTLAKTLRKEMEAFRFASGCGACQQSWARNDLQTIFSRDFDNFPDSTFPAMMEFQISNTCNLACTMCTGALSSRIRKEREKSPPYPQPYDDDFFRQLQPFLPHLKEARFSGAGEAFLIPEYESLWDQLMEINPNCLITIQTNGTVWNRRIQQWLEKGNFKIGISLDSLKANIFEKIRIHAQWQRVMDNIMHFAHYARQKGNSISIATCVMRNNWKEMPDFMHFCNQQGFYLILHRVFSPLSHALHSLPAEELHEIYQFLVSYQWPHFQPWEMHNHWQYQAMLHDILAWKNAAKFDCESTQAIDSNQLLERIKNQIIHHIRKDPHPHLEAQETIIQAALFKLEQVIAAWEEPDKNQLLQQMQHADVSEMVASLRIHPVDRLLDMSKSAFYR